MAYRIEYVNELGRTLQLNALDATTGITVDYLGDIGFGLSPLHHITARGAQQQGDTYVDMRLDPRIIQLPLLVRPGTASGQTRMQRLYYARDILQGIFSPFYSGYVRVFPEWDPIAGGASKILNVRTVGGLTMDVDPQIPYEFRTVVQMRAADPLWYGDLTFQLFTAAQFGPNRFFTNSGTAPSYPSIIITGPVTNCTVIYTQTNTLQSYTITITGTISAGDQFFIDLNPATKSVQDLAGNNQISRVSSTSDFATFVIESGSSALRCTGTGTTGATSVDINWTTAYLGI